LFEVRTCAAKRRGLWLTAGQPEALDVVRVVVIDGAVVGVAWRVMEQQYVYVFQNVVLKYRFKRMF